MLRNIKNIHLINVSWLQRIALILLLGLGSPLKGPAQPVQEEAPEENLSGFQALPMELRLCIADYLDGRSLVHLARTCKMQAAELNPYLKKKAAEFAADLAQARSATEQLEQLAKWLSEPQQQVLHQRLNPNSVWADCNQIYLDGRTADLKPLQGEPRNLNTWVGLLRTLKGIKAVNQALRNAPEACQKFRRAMICVRHQRYLRKHGQVGIQALLEGVPGLMLQIDQESLSLADWLNWVETLSAESPWLNITYQATWNPLQEEALQTPLPNQEGNQNPDPSTLLTNIEASLRGKGFVTTKETPAERLYLKGLSLPIRMVVLRPSPAEPQVVNTRL